MSEWTQLINTAGVASAVLAAVLFALWRISKLASHKLFGNPDVNPPIPGIVDQYITNQKRFFDGLEEHRQSQQQLCDRHATSLENISVILAAHDKLAVGGSKSLEELIAFHTDSSIPHSTAQAIHNVAQLKLAAMSACNGCREAMATVDEPVRDIVMRKCDEIEQILKLQV